VAQPARVRMTDFDHNAIDEVLQSRVRIAIVAFLASAGNVEFAGIRDAIKSSDGNTSVHLRKLEEAGYVSVDKRFVQRKPQTRYALTDRGRTALLDHVAHLEGLLRSKKSGRENDK
jgi:DNA-binding transcriptional ArsR family regulator